VKHLNTLVSTSSQFGIAQVNFVNESNQESATCAFGEQGIPVVQILQFENCQFVILSGDQQISTPEQTLRHERVVGL